MAVLLEVVAMCCPRCRGSRLSVFQHEHAFVVRDPLPGQTRRVAEVARHAARCSLCGGRGALSEDDIARFNNGR